MLLNIFLRAPVRYLVLGMLFIVPCNAYCYIDLGTGSYFLQIAIASIVGVLFTLKMYWKKVGQFIKKIFSRKK